ncbi:hypothetical protein CW748_12405 [Alteromonadales bacterium alter-6D02]|nr:hypothetical protein CW748_12405 [Alteromonadales bacterium alter-6D02]
MTIFFSGAMISPVVFASNTITLDGKLTESQWQKATHYDEFYKVVPATLESTNNKVNARVFTNEQGIYLGFINYQAKGDRKKQYNLQDDFVQADFNRFVIDFSGDGSGAYQFVVALGDGVQDAVLTPQLTTDSDWDGAWEFAIDENDDYWSSEVFIPWHSVSFKAQLDDQGQSSIGVSLQLYDLATNHIYASQQQTTGNSDFYLNMPKIKAKIPQKQQLAFIPYVTQQHDVLSDESTTDVGFDLIYKPNHHQKVSLAVNPDFGQVDSDEIDLNYSAVETLRTDKRPFFTQDINVFNVQAGRDTKLIHTRRIGGGSDDGQTNITPIDAAVRFVHQGEALQFGAFAVSEDELSNDIGKDFYAGRIKYRSEQWQSGILATSVNRPGLDRKGATAAWDSQYQSETWSFQSAFLQSKIEQQQQTIQGYGFSGSAKYQFDQNIDLSASYLRLDDRFDNSDLGYIIRNNWRYSDINYNHSINLENSLFSRVKHGLKASYESNDHGMKLRAQQQYTTSLLLNDGAQLNTTLTYLTSGMEDNIGHQVDPFSYPAHLGARIFYASPYTGWFSWAASYQNDQEGFGGHAQQYAVDMTLMPHPNWNIKFNNFFRTGDGWAIATGDNQVTQYDRDFFVNHIRVTGLLRENLELSFNLQWAILEAKAKDHYHVRDRLLARSEFVGKDLEDKRFTSQVKLRYRLGAYSDIYLVYSRGGVDFQQEVGSRPWLRSLNTLWQERDQDQITAKIRYMF